jgi:molecular chaperone GrpE (heat shock protein)
MMSGRLQSAGKGAVADFALTKMKPSKGYKLRKARSDSPMPDAPIEPSAAGNPPALQGEAWADCASGLSELSERVRKLEDQGAEYHRRSAHREAVIDRLHVENQRLQDESRGSVFNPLTADLMRLYDGLHREAKRLADSAAGADLANLLDTYAEEVELILDRCGLELFTAAPGDPFKAGEHEAVATVESPEDDQNNTIAAVTAVGFRQRATGQVKRPVRAKFYRARKPSEP